MKKLALQSRVHLGAVALVLAVGALAAKTEDIKFKLTGEEETPAVQTDASGSAKLTLDEDHNLTGLVKTKKIDGTAAHIHVGAPGESGPPIVTLVKGEDGEWKIPPGAKFNAEQYTALKEGKLYLNVHSAEHKPGEIRGQLKL